MAEKLLLFDKERETEPCLPQSPELQLPGRVAMETSAQGSAWTKHDVTFDKIHTLTDKNDKKKLYYITLYYTLFLLAEFSGIPTALSNNLKVRMLT